jgi:transposase-like protein
VGHARRAPGVSAGRRLLSGGYGQEALDWRAVDQDGNILDILASRRGDKAAVERFFHERLKGLRYISRVIITEL